MKYLQVHVSMQYVENNVHIYIWTVKMLNVTVINLQINYCQFHTCNGCVNNMQAIFYNERVTVRDNFKFNQNIKTIYETNHLY